MPQSLEYLKAAVFKKNTHSAHSKYFVKLLTDRHKKKA